MNEILVMRTLHIGFGLAWVGLAVLAAIVLALRLRGSSAGTQHPMVRTVTRALGSIVGISAVMTVMVGLAMAFRMTGGTLSVFVSTSWGLAISIGFVASTRRHCRMADHLDRGEPHNRVGTIDRGTPSRYGNERASSKLKQPIGNTDRRHGSLAPDCVSRNDLYEVRVATT